MSYGGPSSTVPTADSTELLRRIERNTAETLRWMKILVGAVVVLIVVTALLFF